MSKITKKQVECYKLRPGGAEGWTDIVIDVTGENSGRLYVASDFGSWEHGWQSCGVSFKKFLTGIGLDYLAGKFKAKNYADIAATLRGYKQNLFADRRAGLGKKTVRRVYNDIKILQNVWLNPGDFELAVSNLENLLAYFDYMPEAVRTYDPMFLRFWNEAWVEFVEYLKEEKI